MGLSFFYCADDEQVKAAKDIMERQTEHLCRLVDDLLDIARISNNNLQFKKQRINLTNVIRIATEDYPLFEKKGVGLCPFLDTP